MNKLRVTIGLIKGARHLTLTGEAAVYHERSGPGSR
jgi:hypothetical protein